MKLAETIRKQNAKIKKLQLFVKNTKIVKTTKKTCRRMKVMKVVKRKVQQVVCSASSASSKKKRTSWGVSLSVHAFDFPALFKMHFSFLVWKIRFDVWFWYMARGHATFVYPHSFSWLWSPQRKCISLSGFACVRTAFALAFSRAVVTSAVFCAADVGSGEL